MPDEAEKKLVARKLPHCFWCHTQGRSGQVTTALVMVSEVGADMGKFPSLCALAVIALGLSMREHSRRWCAPSAV